MSRFTRTGLVAAAVAALVVALVLSVPLLSGASSVSPVEAATSAFSNATVVVTGEVAAVDGALFGLGATKVSFEPDAVLDAQTQDWNVGVRTDVPDLPTDRPLQLRLDPDWTVQVGDVVTVAVSQPFDGAADDDGQITFVLVGDVAGQVDGDAAPAADLFAAALDLRANVPATEVLVELVRDGDAFLDALNTDDGTGPEVQLPGLLGRAAEMVRA